MRNRILFSILIITMSIFLTGCSSNSIDNYNNKKDKYELFDMYDLYVLQSKSKYEVSDCISCTGLKETFCKGIDTVVINGESVTLSEALDKRLLTKTQVECLIEHGVVKHYRFPYIIYKIGEIIFSIIKGFH